MTTDGARKIRTHLFVISPNNSGSTLLRNAIAASTGCWRLPREGQHVEGFRGPSTRSTGGRLIWAATRDRLAPFLNPDSFDWAGTKRAWHAHASAEDPGSSVMTVSSPPFLYCVQALRRAFPGARFLFLTRDPYAVAEGILRRASQQELRAGEDIRTLAAQHVIACLSTQRSNLVPPPADGIAIRYEELCADPAGVGARIMRLVPDLHGLDLARQVSVKGLYDQPLRNMNAHQIASLSKEQLDVIDPIFGAQHTLLDWFGYERPQR